MLIAGRIAEINSKLLIINKELALSINKLNMNSLNFTTTISHSLFY